MQTYLVLKNEQPPLPAEMPGPDVRYPAILAEYFLREFTQEGDVVFDPFAGFGTTLQVAEAMGRIGYGTEINPKRTDYARSQLRHPERLILGDVRHLASLSLPPFNFSISSPPYMGKSDTENPLTDYAEEGAGYAQYLRDLAAVYAEVGRRLAPGGHLVIEASNLKGPNGVTTLAWDIAREVSEVLAFQGEVVIAWENGYGYGYDHSYCLVFK